MGDLAGDEGEAALTTRRLRSVRIVDVVVRRRIRVLVTRS